MDVAEALLHVHNGDWFLCLLVANVPDSFNEGNFCFIATYMLRAKYVRYTCLDAVWLGRYDLESSATLPDALSAASHLLR